jgi:hypothetical protein
MTVQIEGVKETIRELRKIDPEIRRSFDRNVKAIVKPAIDAAQQKYRAEPYPSGTARNWQQGGNKKFPLTGNLAARGAKASIKTTKKANDTIMVVNMNAGAAIFEFANTGSLGAAFRGKNGTPARTLWPSVNARLPRIIEKMEQLIKNVMIQVNGRLATNQGKSAR